MVEARLRANAPLAKQLRDGMEPMLTSEDGVTWQAAGKIPLDGQRAERLFEYIARGLAFWHWGILLPSDSYSVFASSLTRDGQEWFEQLMAMRAIGCDSRTLRIASSAKCSFLASWDSYRP